MVSAVFRDEYIQLDNENVSNIYWILLKKIKRDLTENFLKFFSLPQISFSHSPLIHTPQYPSNIFLPAFSISQITLYKANIQISFLSCILIQSIYIEINISYFFKFFLSYNHHCINWKKTSLWLTASKQNPFYLERGRRGRLKLHNISCILLNLSKKFIINSAENKSLKIYEEDSGKIRIIN